MNLNAEIDVIRIFKLLLLASFLPPVALQILQTYATYTGIINNVDDWGTSEAVFPQVLILWTIIIAISIIFMTRKNKNTPVFWVGFVAFDIFLWVAQTFFLIQGFH